MCNYGNVTGQNIVGGLIGYAEKDNLHLGSGGDDERKYDIDCNVTGNGIYVGGIIGQLEVNVSTTSAYLCGDLVASVYGGNSTGGCIGYLHMEKHCDVLELCRDSQVSVTGDIGTGGFIGKLQMASTDAYLTITTEDHLISSGNTIYPASSNSSAYGGLIGLLNRDSYSSSKSTYVEFLNCYNYLQIVGGETSSNNNSGGFIGKANNTYVKIEQSCNHADISPNGTTKGGFIGYFTNDNSSDDKTLVELYISESFNAGDIISDDKRGGFVGSISNSYLNVSNSYCTGTLDGDGKYVAGFAGHCESFGSKNNIHYKFVDCFSSAKETGWGTISGDSFHKGELYFDDVYYRSSNDDPLPESNSDNDGEETVGLDIATLKTYSLSDFGFSTTYWNDEGTDALPTLKNNSGKAN